MDDKTKMELYRRANMKKAVLRRLLALLTQVNPRLRCLIRHSKDSRLRERELLRNSFTTHTLSRVFLGQIGSYTGQYKG